MFSGRISLGVELFKNTLFYDRRVKKNNNEIIRIVMTWNTKDPRVEFSHDDVPIYIHENPGKHSAKLFPECLLSTWVLAWGKDEMSRSYKVYFSLFRSPGCLLWSSGSAACKWCTYPSHSHPSYQVTVLSRYELTPHHLYHPCTTHHFVVSSSPPPSHTQYLYLCSGCYSTLLVPNSCRNILFLLLLLESLLRGRHLVIGFKTLKL